MKKDNSITKFINISTRIAKRFWVHLISLSFRKKIMIISLLVISSSYYSAPVGVGIMSVGLVLDYRKSPERQIPFRKIARNSIIFYPGVLFLLSALIGPIYFGHYMNALLALVVLGPVLFCAFAIEVLWKKEDALHFARYASILVIPIAIYAFLFPWSGGSLFSHTGILRLASTFSNPNYFSYILEIILIFSIALYYHIWKKSSRGWLVISFILSLLCLFFTGSRSGMLAFLIGITVFYLCMSEKVVLVTAFGALTLILALTAIFPEQSVMLFRDVIPRPQTFLSEIGNRFMLWDVALKQIIKNPIMGTGFDSYHYLIPKNAPAVLKSAMHCHNIFINLWLETGIVGICSFIWIFVRATINAVKELKDSPVRPFLAAGIGMVVITVIHGIMDAPLVSAQTLALYTIFLACLIVMSRKSSNF